MVINGVLPGPVTGYHTAPACPHSIFDPGAMPAFLPKANCFFAARWQGATGTSATF